MPREVENKFRCHLTSRISRNVDWAQNIPLLALQCLGGERSEGGHVSANQGQIGLLNANASTEDWALHSLQGVGVQK